MDFNGQKEFTGAFPKDFRVLQDGKTFPFIRLGADKIRFLDEIPNAGQIDVVPFDRVRRNVTRRVSDIAIIAKEEVDAIDVIAKQNAIQTKKNSETIASINELAENIAGLETDNAQKIELFRQDAQKSFDKVAQDIATLSNSTANGINEAVSVSQKASELIMDAHLKTKNPHGITKNTVGLDKVDNTSDIDKPVSKAVQEALDEKADKSSLEEVSKSIDETNKKQEKLENRLERISFSGGVGGSDMPSGGKKGQVIIKKSDADGSYGWGYPQTYIHEQGIASDEWIIQHNLGKFPSVTVVDSGNNVIVPDVQYINKNKCIVRMNGASKGRAYLN